jgi:hypothetical protein
MRLIFGGLIPYYFLFSAGSEAFVLPRGANPNQPRILSTTTTATSTQTSSSSLWSSLKEDTDKETKASTSSSSSSSSVVTEQDPDAEGLPWWWELVWKLDIMKTGEEGKEIIFGDTANVLRTNIEQIYGGYPSLDGCPLAEGEITNIADGTMFIGLQTYFENYGSPYKLCFGPKSFLVISDPIQARHLLRDANKNYDKVSQTYNLCFFLLNDDMNTLFLTTNFWSFFFKGCSC